MADVFDALTTERPDRGAVSYREGAHLIGEKRREKLNPAHKAAPPPPPAVAYGRILEICAPCHRKFRD